MNLIEVAKYSLEHATELSLLSEDHGPRHWRDVARIGFTLGRSEELDSDRLDAVFIFAVLHDSQRKSELVDPRHGHRAAQILHRLLDDKVIEEGDWFIDLDYALSFHESGEHVAKVQHQDGPKQIGTCWDADRLTIGRVGIITSVEYMSTVTVRNDFSAALKMANEIRLGPDRDWDEIASMYERHRVG